MQRYCRNCKSEYPAQAVLIAVRLINIAILCKMPLAPTAGGWLVCFIRYISMTLLQEHFANSSTADSALRRDEHPIRPTKVRVALPAFNEELALIQLIPRIVQTLSETPWDYDILVVDDGSTDGTVHAAKELQVDYPVMIHRHDGNRGLGAAITTCLTEGIRGLSDDDIVVAMDSDNTHPPQLITRMVPMIREGHDIVIASRYQPGARVVGLARHREYLSIGVRYMMQLLLPIRGCRDYTCGYRAYRVGLVREAIEKLDGVLVREAGFASMADLLLTLNRLGAVVGEVPMLLRYD
jgi:dolichol-phosphate mannosyltransferase